MGVLIIVGFFLLAVFLFFAGVSEIERRAERWERYERWMHPPDDEDDGVSLLEDIEKHK